MDERTVGLVGGIAGGVLGLLGGAVGTYFGVVNTGGPRERSFALRASATVWAVMASFLAGMWATPPALRPLWWLPIAAGLPLAIRYGNRELVRLRREHEEARGRPREADDGPRA